MYPHGGTEYQPGQVGQGPPQPWQTGAQYQQGYPQSWSQQGPAPGLQQEGQGYGVQQCPEGLQQQQQPGYPQPPGYPQQGHQQQHGYPQDWSQPAPGFQQQQLQNQGDVPEAPLNGSDGSQPSGSGETQERGLASTLHHASTKVGRVERLVHRVTHPTQEPQYQVNKAKAKVRATVHHAVDKVLRGSGL